MKKVSAILFISLFFQHVNAQQAFEKNDNFIQLGYGPGLLYDQVLTAYDNKREYAFSGFGPAYLGYERALTKHFGLGLAVSFSQYGADWDSTGVYTIPPVPGQPLPVPPTEDVATKYSIGVQSLSVMLRGTYHIALCNDQLDPYFGIGLGYTANTLSWGSKPIDKYDSDTSFNEISAPVDAGSAISYQVFAGARYMFSRSKYNFISRCGLMAEIGYFGIFGGVPYGNIGLTFKF
jgi:opacity protein-like surface antigen